MLDIFRFPFIKTISSRRFSKCIGLANYPLLKQVEQDFICRIKFGNILKSSGDILLCPLSEDFKPSNPLSRKIIEREGKWLKRIIEELYSSENPQWIGSEHVVFLPCRKLKYRGILFVSVDFYSDTREEVNAERIGEALTVAHKYNCKKLTCPQNLLYSHDDKFGFDYIYHQWNDIVLRLKDKIDFVIETLVQKNWVGFNMLQSSIVYYDFSSAMTESLPYCAQILMHYRNKIRSIGTVYYFSARTARQIRRLLTEPIKHKKALHLFKKLQRIMGVYSESGVDRCNEGYEFFILEMCREMPWNFLKLKELFESLPEDKYGSFDDFIFKERFQDLTKFEYRSKS